MQRYFIDNKFINTENKTAFDIKITEENLREYLKTRHVNNEEDELDDEELF